MKKQFLIVAFLFACSTLCWSQKIDLDKSYASYSRRVLPTKPLPTELRSYKVVVLSNLSDAINKTKADNVYIAGLAKNESGALKVNFQFDEIFINKSTTTERVAISKEKDGREIRSYFYKMDIEYALNATCSVISNNGLTIYTNVESPKRTYSTKEYPNAKEAQDFWINNMPSLKNKIIDDVMNDYIMRTVNILNAQIGYPTYTESIILWTTDSPKHAENDVFAKNTKSATEKLKRIEAFTSVEPVAQSLSEEIAYFESIKGKYTSAEKADLKLRYGAFYNLAVIFIALDQPEKAKLAGEALIANDYDKADGRRIVSLSEEIIQAFTLNKINTKHFDDVFISTH